MVAVLTRLGLQRVIRQWRTNDPQQLAEQLSQHQQDVAESLTRIAGGALPRLPERPVGAGTHNARVDEMLVVDTTGGDARVALPEATARNAGAVCAVLKISQANVLRVSAARGGSAWSFYAPGIRTFVCTSRGWWSLGGDAEGTYSPNYSAGSGIDLTNPRNASFRWHCTGNTMHVDGRVTVDLDSPSGEKEFRISLPRDPRADFTSTTDAHGSGSMVASSLATECQSVMVESVISTSLVRVVSTSAAASGARAFRFHFVYRL